MSGHVDGRLRAPRDSHADLEGRQAVAGGLGDLLAEALAHQAAQGLADANRAEAAVVLRERHKRGASEVSRDRRRGLAAGEHVDKTGELLDDLVPVGCRRQGVLQVLRAQARGAGG